MGSRSSCGPKGAAARAFTVSAPSGPAVQARRRGAATPEVAQRLIASIYDAALDPEVWPTVLAALSDALGGSSAVFFSQDTLRRVGFIMASRIDSSELGTYSAHYAAKDVWVSSSFHHPAGTVVGGGALFPVEDFVKGEFYNDFLRRLDIFHMIGTVVENRDSQWATAGIFRPLRSGDFGPDEHRLMELVSPHLRRAVEIRRRFAGLEVAAAAVLEALDRLPTGVIILDVQVRVTAVNRHAHEILAQQDGLRVGPGGMEAALPQQTRRLRALVHAAAKAGVGDTGGAMILERPSYKRPLELLVTPLRLSDGERTTRAVAIFVNDPERQPQLTADLLRRHHGLTPAEARLAAALADGVSLKDFADHAAISLNTARWTLKHVFAKTGTRRQAELVRLLLSGLAALRMRPSP